VHDTHTKCASTQSVPALAEGGAIKLAKPWLTDLPLPEKAEYIVACSAPFDGALVWAVFTPGASSASGADLFRYFVRALHFLP
jgi:hypothetical protein